MRTQILSPYTGDGLAAETAYRPLLDDDYRLTSWIDYTNAQQPNIIPDVNLLAVTCVMEVSVFAEISADDTYYVVWDEPNPRSPNDVPPAAEFGLLRAYMARNGVSNADFVAAFGHGPNGRTRRQIGDDVSSWLRDRSKTTSKKNTR